MVSPKASWADWICRTHQHYHRQWLSNTEPEQGTDGYGRKDFDKRRVVARYKLQHY